MPKLTVKETTALHKEQTKFFKSLITMNYAQAGAEIGLDRKYQKANSLRAASYKYYNAIDPKELDIDADIVEMVVKAIEGRRIHKTTEITEVDSTALINPEDTKAVIMGGRNKAAMLLHKKMDYINKSKKALDGVSLTQLATTFGIFFDKSQIIQGQSTENIAVVSKIENDLTPEELQKLTLKQREDTIEGKDTK